jgi:hypothetical protein
MPPTRLLFYLLLATYKYGYYDSGIRHIRQRSGTYQYEIAYLCASAASLFYLITTSAPKFRAFLPLPSTASLIHLVTSCAPASAQFRCRRDLSGLTERCWGRPWSPSTCRMTSCEPARSNQPGNLLALYVFGCTEPAVFYFLFPRNQLKPNPSQHVLYYSSTHPSCHNVTT